VLEQLSLRLRICPEARRVRARAVDLEQPEDRSEAGH
jgi:hypothetical protein